MEAELLREMISDRDARILRIRRKTEGLNDRETKLREEMTNISKESEIRCNNYKIEKNSLVDYYHNMMHMLKDMEITFRQQGQSLHSYASVVQKDRIGDSSYIMRMQAQLCKAMHSMGICDHQLDLMKTHCDNLIKHHRDIVTKQTEEKTQMELVLMNDLMLFDNERRKVEQDYKKQLDDIRKERDSIEKQLEENRDEDEDSTGEGESESEEDEEEKEMKEELMNVLQEKNGEIEVLERESQERQDHIRELEEQLVELGAEITRSKTLFKTPKKRTDSDEDDEDDDEDDETEEYDDDEDDEDEADNKNDISPLRNQNTSGLPTFQNVSKEKSDDDEDEENDDESEENDDEDEENDDNKDKKNSGNEEQENGMVDENEIEMLEVGEDKERSPSEGSDSANPLESNEKRNGEYADEENIADEPGLNNEIALVSDKIDSVGIENEEEKKESFHDLPDAAEANDVDPATLVADADSIDMPEEDDKLPIPDNPQQNIAISPIEKQ
jgi:hypothetical protein